MLPADTSSYAETEPAGISGCTDLTERSQTEHSGLRVGERGKRSQQVDVEDLPKKSTQFSPFDAQRRVGVSDSTKAYRVA